MSIKMRVNNLELAFEPHKKIERERLEEQKEDEKFYNLMNDLVRNAYPEHRWNQLTESEQRAVKTSNENGLYVEVLRLYLELLNFYEDIFYEGITSGEFEKSWAKEKYRILERLKS